MEVKVIINGEERTLKAKDVTRKMTREINEVLFKGVEIDMSGGDDLDNVDFKLPMENVERSNELRVKLIFGLSQDDVDQLKDQDFKKLVDAASKKK
jgi:hypothetical protein